MSGGLVHEDCGGEIDTDYGEEGVYGTTYYCEDCDERVHPTEAIPAEIEEMDDTEEQHTDEE